MLRTGCAGVLPKMCGFRAGRRRLGDGDNPAGISSEAYRVAHVGWIGIADDDVEHLVGAVDRDAHKKVVAAEGANDDAPRKRAVSRKAKRVGPDRVSAGTQHTRHVPTEEVGDERGSRRL